MFRGGALGVMERWKPDCTSALVLGEIMSKNIFYEKICYVMNSWRYDLIPGFARTPLVFTTVGNMFVLVEIIKMSNSKAYENKWVKKIINSV